MALQTTVENVTDPAEVTILSLVGELDGASYEKVIDIVRDAYASGARRLLLDLSGLEFISSAGLVAVHSSLRLMAGEAPPDPEYGWQAIRELNDDVDAGRGQASVRVCGTSDGVWKVLDRTGLGALIPAYPDRAAALAAF
jgi:anti-anti-sigma factor